MNTLGAELISSDRVALVELVKNAYDADATICVIAYDRTVDGRGRLLVLDDGHGMTGEELTNGWLELAGTKKVRNRVSESKQRRLLGEKGVGRLAASRLGPDLLVTSKRVESPECQLLIDWEQFNDPDKFLDEIDVAVTVGESSDISSTGAASQVLRLADVTAVLEHGTLLDIGGTSLWAREDVAEIRRALQRLIAPVADGTRGEFKIYLSMPTEFEDLSGEVGPPEFSNDPLYRASAEIDKDGLATVTLDGDHPRMKRRILREKIWERQDRAPACGPFALEVRVWDRDKEGVTLAAPTLGVRDFRRQLDVMAGVSVYRDGFRVFPYGERGDDWLGLDSRRVNQPSLRLSNNQLVGFVYLSDEKNPKLHDQSNREGLIENDAFLDLRTMVVTILSELEAARRSIRRHEPTAKPTGGLFSELDLKDLADDLRSSGAGPQVLEAVEEKAERVSNAVEVVKSTLSQFQLHATLGQLVDRVVHEGRNAIGPLRNKLDMLKRAISADDVELMTKRRDQLSDTVERQTSLLAALFDGLDPLSGRRRGRPANVNAMHALTEAARASDIQLCPSANIVIVGDDSLVRWAESDAMLAVVNLINNSLYWLNRDGPADKIVRVSFNRLSDRQVRIRVSDNGPGVGPGYESHIFDPYFSRKPNGVGLGLAIVGSIAEAYGGSLTLSPDSELGGATFDLILGRHV
ncbi:sensor histidine kinase [Flexivirga endophytica]|uniref:sensor histidine kinase n=1 Tax=Flexivirga endophytica TaxID=1849103 RepID=UPI0016731AF6|nr:ATP-binding protein [Flexivirga endophytica]